MKYVKVTFHGQRLWAPELRVALADYALAKEHHVTNGRLNTMDGRDSYAHVFGNDVMRHLARVGAASDIHDGWPDEAPIEARAIATDTPVPMLETFGNLFPQFDSDTPTSAPDSTPTDTPDLGGGGAFDETKSVVVMVTVPAHLVGRPVADVKRVLSDPRNGVMDFLADEVYRWINAPDLSLDMLIARMESERKALARPEDRR